MHYLRRNAGKPILLVPRDVTRTKCSTWAAAAAIRHGIAWMTMELETDAYICVLQAKSPS